MLNQAERNVYTTWGGDFNTLPCSPLYNYIRYSSIDDLKRYKIDNWTGQYSGLNIHSKMIKKSVDIRLSILSEKFDYKKHGKYLNCQEDEHYFDNLTSTLNKLSVKLEGDQVKIRPRDETTIMEPLKLKSAYAEDFAFRNEKDTKTAGLVGEMEYSTIPKQDPYPVTVDYIL